MSTGFRSMISTKWNIAWIMILAVCIFASTPASAQDDKAADAVKFFDSGAFDRQLSSALKKDPAEVHIDFPVAINVNKIPDRLDKWFYQVEYYEGTVELKEDETVTTRGILGIVLDLIIGVYEIAKDKIMYGPVKDYNCVIYYDKSDGTITDVVFVRKPEVG